MRPLTAWCIAALLLPWFPIASQAATPAELAAQVRAAESGFAQSMADRDFKAFSKFVSEEAVFFGEADVSRGKSAVQAAWKKFFDAAEAPFSWRPEHVEVLPSGTLAHSSGPVFDRGGRQVGTFNSIWRLENGEWRVIFDKGCTACNCTR